MKIKILTLILLTLLAPEFSQAKKLRVRGLGDPLTFDWNRAYTPVEATTVRNIMEGLVEIEPTSTGKSKVSPSLSSHWTISKDRKTYTFYLKKNIKWTDGVELDAQQFVDSWKRLLDPKFNANYAYLLFDIEGAEDFHKGLITDFSKVGIKATTPLTLEVKLRTPITTWIWIPTFWATFPIRADLIEKDKTNWDKPANLVTLGPYLLSRYEPHRTIQLKKNPTYYQKCCAIDEIETALISDELNAVDLFLSGQIDFITKIGVESRRLRDRPELTHWNEARTVYLSFNPTHPTLQNPEIRKAIALAIDKNQLISNLDGANKAATSFIPEGVDGYSKKDPFAFDPKKAKAILNSISATEREKITTLDFLIPAFSDDILAAEFIKESLKIHLDLNVRIQKLEPKLFYSPLTKSSGFAMMLNKWTADYPDPDNFYSIFLSTAGNNRVGWSNSNFDELVLKARRTEKMSERLNLYAKAQTILIDQTAIAIPIYYGKNNALLRSGLKGFKPNPTNAYLFKTFDLK